MIYFCRTLLSPDIRDEVGELTVGGLASSNFYTGTLQDVRIYLAPVTLPRYVNNGHESDGLKVDTRVKIILSCYYPRC